MALSAQDMAALVDEFEEFLAAKHSEETMDGPEPGMGGPPAPHAEPDGDEGGKPPGLGVVIEMAPKGAPRGQKVPGCADCESGTPHSHMGR